jgi:hypothetical protein
VRVLATQLVAGMPELSSLVLFAFPATDSLRAALPKLTALTSLELGDTKVTPKVPQLRSVYACVCRTFQRILLRCLLGAG